MLTLSDTDRQFKTDFESGQVPLDEFDHRAHLRLAYIYVVETGADLAYQRMRGALEAFLRVNNIESGKYHDTMTRAWVMAVRHFMEKTAQADSADTFIDQNPMMLDSRIMLSHYSADLLFSDEARAAFVEPDLSPIPQY